MSQNYEAIIQTIYDLKDVLLEDEWNQLLQKYVPSLFNHFFDIYKAEEAKSDIEEIKEEENEGEEDEEKEPICSE